MLSWPQREPVFICPLCAANRSVKSRNPTILQSYRARADRPCGIASSIRLETTPAKDLMKILLYNPDNGVTRNFMPHLWMFYCKH